MLTTGKPLVAEGMVIEALVLAEEHPVMVIAPLLVTHVSCAGRTTGKTASKTVTSQALKFPLFLIFITQ